MKKKLIIAIVILVALVCAGLGVFLWANGKTAAIKVTKAQGGEGIAEIQWNEIEDASGYSFYDVDGVKKDALDNVEVTTRQDVVVATIKGLKNGEHVIRVQAKNGMVADVPVTTNVQTPPVPQMQARPIDQGAIEFTWDKVNLATDYVLYRHDDKSDKWDKIQKTSKTSCTERDLTPGTSYQYRLRAIRTVNDASSASDFAEATVTARGKIRAVVFDYRNRNSERMVRYLDDAGYEVSLVESLSELNTDDYDMLVIPGGNNVTPELYGQTPDPHTYGTNREKDQMQISGIQMFADAGKVVLGVCRGCQIVNVALGGTINQHIPGWHKKYRNVKTDPSSCFYPMLGDVASVYHYHHQCVEELAEGLVATQWDEQDGRIEGYEHESLPIYGVQWHPDLMNANGVEIFREFQETVYRDME